MKETTVSAVDNVQAALRRALAIRPKVGGFPVLAEVLRQAGVRRNIWNLPAAESLYLTDHGDAIFEGPALLSGPAPIPAFDREALIRALRTDQAGQSTFPEFLAAAWKAGVVRYEVDFDGRTVTYRGARGQEYVESYPSAKV